ncbi:MAG: amino acid permease, partial [bacterium]|nr:amino acid permease [bacterium]
MSNGVSQSTEDSGQHRNQFGWFGGVFTPCTLTILGVIMFMRANFVVGQAGILQAILILLLAKSITFFTALSTSAIGTNMQVRGGGAYYLISRVLGPEFGGAIGIVLFLAQAISVPFYVLGFTEALCQTFEPLKPHYAAIAFGTAGLLFVITYIGASWAIKVQYVIMAILGVSIVVFMGGALRFFSFETLSQNFSSGFTAVDPAEPSKGTYDFWQVFAIYFPAVTGIMAGINMS